MGDPHIALLAHLIGDGCTLPRHTIQYTTSDLPLAETVARLARQAFGVAVEPRIHQERTWYQVYLPASARLTHGRRNPIAAWLDGLGVFGLRSHEKLVPPEIFEQPAAQIALFLRHLWATDGCMHLGHGTTRIPRIYYASSSRQLARDVQSLLLASVSAPASAASRRRSVADSSTTSSSAVSPTSCASSTWSGRSAQAPWLMLSQERPQVASNPSPLAPLALKYVGDDTCARCHSQIAKTYHQHPMARSCAPVSSISALERYERNSFEAAGFQFLVEPRDQKVFHKTLRLDSERRPLAQSEVEVQFAIGAGIRGRSYLADRDGYLFQSPISWHSERQVWDLSPHLGSSIDQLYRPVQRLCLFLPCQPCRSGPGDWQSLSRADFPELCHRMRARPRTGRVPCPAPPGGAIRLRRGRHCQSRPIGTGLAGSGLPAMSFARSGANLAAGPPSI